MYISGLMFSKSKFRDSFPGGENMDLLLISDAVNLMLKPIGGETEGLILLFS